MRKMRALVDLRYGGCDYKRGDVIAMRLVDARLLERLGRVEQMPQSYKRRDMQAEPLELPPWSGRRA